MKWTALFQPTTTIVGWLIIGIICGGIASTIAWNRCGNLRYSVSFFVLGFLLPLIGIILAFFVKPVGDWYPDPWQEADERWHDGCKSRVLPHPG